MPGLFSGFVKAKNKKFLGPYMIWTYWLIGGAGKKTIWPLIIDQEPSIFQSSLT